MERIFLTKYIIITGGVVSSIEKRNYSASMGRILRSYGLKKWQLVNRSLFELGLEH